MNGTSVRIQFVDGIAERNDDPSQECGQHCLMEAYGMVWDLSRIPVTASGLALVVFDVSGKALLCLGFITGVGVF